MDLDTISCSVDIDINKKCLAAVDKLRDGAITKRKALTDICVALYSSPDFNKHDRESALSTYYDILEQEGTPSNWRSRADTANPNQDEAGSPLGDGNMLEEGAFGKSDGKRSCNKDDDGNVA
jgi:hypothetical protein